MVYENVLLPFVISLSRRHWEKFLRNSAKNLKKLYVLMVNIFICASVVYTYLNPGAGGQNWEEICYRHSLFEA